MVGNNRRSLQELSAEVATNPNSTAFVELAAAYRERGDLQRALWLCLRGLQRHPTHVEAHFELGRIYEARGERELALDEWSIVRQLAPDHLPSRLALVRFYLDEGRRNEAERELRAAEELAPGDAAIAELWNELVTLSEDGDRGGPAAVFDSMLDEYPGTLGVMLVDSEGRLVAGRIPEKRVESDLALAVNLAGARSEAERVASYLDMGELRGIVVESDSVRLTVSPVGGHAIIVATASETPAGLAARAVQRAWEIAEEHLGRETR
jgi:predicted regulator of Ras-like GTPase activity (Roadblock/LC7/MglB family)